MRADSLSYRDLLSTPLHIPFVRDGEIVPHSQNQGYNVTVRSLAMTQIKAVLNRRLHGVTFGYKRVLATMCAHSHGCHFEFVPSSQTV